MDSRENLIRAAEELIREKDGNVDDITVREICRRAGTGLGLVNYHFGNKDRLIAICVERMVQDIVAGLEDMKMEGDLKDPFERLYFMGDTAMEFLFANPALSRISILKDMHEPERDDSTMRTWGAFLPAVAACRPGWSDEKLRRRTMTLITMMQQAFLRRDAYSQALGMDLLDREDRKRFHRIMLEDVLEVDE